MPSPVFYALLAGVNRVCSDSHFPAAESVLPMDDARAVLLFRVYKTVCEDRIAVLFVDSPDLKREIIGFSI